MKAKIKFDQDEGFYVARAVVSSETQINDAFACCRQAMKDDARVKNPGDLLEWIEDMENGRLGVEAVAVRG